MTMGDPSDLELGGVTHGTNKSTLRNFTLGLS